jgi:peptidyl-Asp metalloendopeptidase
MQARPMIRILPLALALLAAGCADDWRPRTAGGLVAKSANAGAAGSGMVGLADGIDAAGAQPTAAGFAHLPDRGDLVGYPAQRVVRRDGAYTWHRADLSEAHALAAIADGSMRVTTPSGQTLDFVYERHEEHPSGDWTWVGRLENGSAAEEVVLTFGDRAAFGTIAQPGREPLRLTIRDGASWLIETDGSRVAEIRNRATQPKGPDYLVPPSSVASRETAASAPVAASAPTMAAAASTASTPVIDLVLGYTPGFATMYGGQSQAVTRLNNMVAITNEAYANSQMTGRVRLVHTLQVNYADNTDNGDALEKLSGYKSGSGWITPDPALNALRAARDQYGGDLVSLVRKFNDPENDGCGIAWMIGGGGSTVDTGDAPFGYSVVSDGQDQGTDGKTYFCREETLAHEIGHNLGSQHDKATATKDGKVSQGAYAYSFGYKTDAANGNFYTVMAYGDSGQKRYRAFSNPLVTFCGGYACGVADQADNARSLALTMPVIAQFRATIVPSSKRARQDINGDGRSDLLWFRPSDGRLAYWLMNGGAITAHGGVLVGVGWFVQAVGDFNGDGLADLIWNRAAGDMQYWAGDGASFATRQFLANKPEGWNLLGARDVDGDGKDDLLWNSTSDGVYRLEYWIMDGPVIRRKATFSVNSEWHIQAIGDFNGDGRVDLIWNRPWGDMQFWAGDGAGFATRQYFTQYPQGWQMLEARDIDGDAKDDLLWFRQSDGRLAYWVMNGPGITRHGGISVGAGPVGNHWFVEAGGDFNGDGRVDLIWNRTWGDMQFWSGDGDGFANRQYFTSYPTGWSRVQ